MTVTQNAVDTLEELFESGAFSSLLDQYLDAHFRHETRESWYTKTLAEDGHEAAERRLSEWARNLHFDVFSSTIEPIIEGVIALAKAKPELLTDITQCDPGGYQAIDERYGPRHKFLLYNTQVPGCGCSQAAGSYIFGPYSALGLKAVIIEAGFTREGRSACLQLVLPAWKKVSQTAFKSEFVLAELETTGSSRGKRYSPYIYINGDSEEYTDTDTYLKHMLGITTLENIGGMVEMSSIEQLIGFPGAEEYLAAKLPDLGTYFGALAEKLSTTHTH
jgi:hypothetical protein